MRGFLSKPFHRRYAGSSGLAIFVLVVLVGAGFFGLKMMPKQCVITRHSIVPGDFAAFTSALKMYKINAGCYPSTQQGLMALVDCPLGNPVPTRWYRVMDRIKPDPWGSEYIYQFPGSVAPTEFEIISKGPDGNLGTSDDIRNN